MPAAVSLAVFLMAGVAAWSFGGEGLVRPNALGHWLPVLAWPIVGRASGALAEADFGRTFAVFAASLVLTLLFSGLVALYASTHGTALGALIISANEQHLIPGTAWLGPYGLYFHRLKIAHLLLFVVGPLWARQLVAPLSRCRRVCEGLLLLFCQAALAATFARAAYFGMLAGMVISTALALTWHSERRLQVKRTLGAAILCLMVALFFLPSLRARLQSAGGAAARNSRATIWACAVEIAWQHPLGCGLGNYPALVQGHYANYDQEQTIPRTYPHSLMWMGLCESGLIGLLGLLSFFTNHLVRAVEAVRLSSSSAAHWPLGWMATLTGLCVVGLSHDVLYHAPVALVFFAACGFMDGAQRKHLWAPKRGTP